MLDYPEHGFALAGVKGPLKLDDVLLAAKKANRVAPLQVVRADHVIGADHLLSAAIHAQRSMNEGRNHADRLEVEFTRYAAGRRQIRQALEHMGVPDNCPGAVLCAFGEKRLDALPYFIDFLGLETDDSLLDPSPKKLADFGITDSQLAATDDAHRYELALEAVASVDLMRK